VITGPTASGKSGLAVDLALETGGEIINADSMQVYRGMDIGTAKIRTEEMKGVPHHLIDVVEPDENYNAALYRDQAIPLIREITERGKRPVVVGGTGLYIKTLLGGLFECPNIESDLRERLRRECDEKGTEVLHDLLRDMDPESADRIHVNDRIRILRALEIVSATGKPASSLMAEHGFRDRPFESLKICLDVKREILYERINRRSRDMMTQGLLEETRALLQKGFSEHLKPMQAIGYRQMVEYLKGAMDLETAVEQLKTQTRRYAKRQLTWFRGDPEMIWLSPFDTAQIRERARAFFEEPA
jgi:tRNA dimethylallyltransferase